MQIKKYATGESGKPPVTLHVKLSAARNTAAKNGFGVLVFSSAKAKRNLPVHKCYVKYRKKSTAKRR